ncbi:MAG: alpha-glucosidase [Cyclobacteriaceae bacterium]|nr:alpha-glucosidase [Cyclobacteriaceae bacterium]
MNNPAWWKEAVVYQIYPRSFKDSNADGIGDLRGVIEKLDYIQSLGVDAVWLNPIFKSPNDDGGYDISDYYALQPEFGTMVDFDDLLAGLHQRKLKLIIDLVLNHSSDEHEWFQLSRQGKKPYTDFYFWKPGTPDAPPNNWPSFFGGSAWQWDAGAGKYYLHLFSKKQPDLNWETPALRQELYKVMRYWLDKGVDGLRLDVISAISKRTDFPNTDTDDFNETIRKYYANGPRLREFIAEARTEVWNKYDVMTVGEGPGITPQNALEFLHPQQGLNMLFHFGHMFLDQGPGGRFDPIPWTMKEFKQVFETWNATFQQAGWGSVFLGNHDFPRMVSRWGNDTLYRQESSKLLCTLLLTMPGTPFIYMGDEIGMTNTTLTSMAASLDVETQNGWVQARASGIPEAEFLKYANYAGRDNARTPVQWTADSHAGFSTARPWMPVNANYAQVNVAQQQADPQSTLTYFKNLTQLRKRHRVLTHGSYKSIETTHQQLFAYEREWQQEKLLVVLNFSDQVVNLPNEVTAYPACLISNYPAVNPELLQPWEARIYTNKK